MLKLWKGIMFFVWMVVLILLVFWSVVRMAEIHEENKPLPRHYQGQPIDPRFY